MSILSKIGFKKELKDVYAGVKHLKCVDIINHPEALMAHDENGADIELNMNNRRTVADGLKSIKAETGVAYDSDDTVERYISRAAIGALLKEYDELEELRQKAEEIGA